MATCTPASANSRAQAHPAMPAPTITTSNALVKTEFLRETDYDR
jgi:hypothetical protein